MIQITDKSSCSGCTACMAVCNRRAISMEPDALGFLYPKVDAERCFDCGLCDNVCNFKKPASLPDGFPLAYLMRHKSRQEVLRSKSGGAFVLLSDVVLREGGVVYGARLNDSHLVEHDRATDQNRRDLFRGSKYIQSDLRNLFVKVKADLIDGATVLFSGTPCQVAGLKSYLGPKLLQNLYLVDILCHGVASPAIWNDWLKHIETRKGKKVQQCIPRDPRYGWDNSVDSFIFEDGSEYKSEYFTGYIYHKWITQRWSCNVCPFTSLDRVSDITIGDAWGANRVMPDFDKENIGSSIVLINTEKGRRLFDEASINAFWVPVDINEMMQPVLKHPTALHPKRWQFEKAYAQYGFNRVRHRYLNYLPTSIKRFTRHSLRLIKHTIFQ